MSHSAARCISTFPTLSVMTDILPNPAGYGRHDVTVAAGSRLAAALGQHEVAVPTHHHQSIAQLGKGLVATAWTADGVIEAAEFDSAESDHARHARRCSGTRRRARI